jgi:hypothetical protein
MRTLPRGELEGPVIARSQRARAKSRGPMTSSATKQSDSLCRWIASLPLAMTNRRRHVAFRGRTPKLPPRENQHWQTDISRRRRGSRHLLAGSGEPSEPDRRRQMVCRHRCLGRRHGVGLRIRHGRRLRAGSRCRHAGLLCAQPVLSAASSAKSERATLKTGSIKRDERHA